jgi:hypothetical protein
MHKFLAVAHFYCTGILLESWKEVQAVIEETQSVIPSVMNEIPTNKAKEDAPLHITKVSRRLAALPTPPLSKSASSTSLSHLSSALVDHNDSNSNVKVSTQAQITFEPISLRSNDSTRKRSASVYSQDAPTELSPLTVHLLSKNLGKAQMAEVTKEFALAAINAAKKGSKSALVDSLVHKKDNYSISIDSLGSRLEGTRSDLLLNPDSWDSCLTSREYPMFMAFR